MKYIVIGLSLAVTLLVTGYQKETAEKNVPNRYGVSIAGSPVYEKDYALNLDQEKLLASNQ